MKRRAFIQAGVLSAVFAAAHGLFAEAKRSSGFILRIGDAQAVCLRELVARGHLFMNHTSNHHFYIINYGDC